jgi:hypothetical protein
MAYKDIPRREGWQFNDDPPDPGGGRSYFSELAENS